MRDLCSKSGLSRLGTKLELLKRLESFENDNDNDGRRVVKWMDRGRKVATRPSETVGMEESSEDEHNMKYSELRKEELKRQFIDRNLPVLIKMKMI